MSMIFFAWLFGVLGWILSTGLIVYFTVCYFIWHSLDLDADEKVFGSVAVGFSLFALLVWLSGLVIGSLRLGAVLAIAIITIIGTLVLKLRRR